MNNYTIKIKYSSLKHATRDEKYDYKISTFVCLYSLLGVINITIKICLPIEGSMWSLISNIFTVILLLFFLRIIPAIIERRVATFIGLEMLFVLVYLMSFCWGLAEWNLLFSNLFTSICIVVPLGVSVLSIQDKNILYNSMIKFSYLIEIISVICIFVSLGKSYEYSYSMSLANYMLIFIIAQCNEAFETSSKRILHVICAAYGTMFILLYGNRAPLLAIAVFLVVKLIKSVERTTYKWIAIIGIILLSIVFINYGADFVAAISNKLSSQGRFSYTISHLEDGSFFESESRIDLFSYYLGLIKQRPILGWGVYGGFIGEGNGPHNIIIELVLAFGIPIGGIISIFVITTFIIAFVEKADGTNAWNLRMIFAASVVMKLFTGGGVFVTPNLLIFVLLFWNNRTHKRLFI